MIELESKRNSELLKSKYRYLCERIKWELTSVREIKERTLRDVEKSSYILYRMDNNSEKIRWAGFYVETKSECTKCGYSEVIR